CRDDGLHGPGKLVVDLVAVFERIRPVSPSPAVAIDIVGKPASPSFSEFQPLAVRLGVRIDGMELENADLMAGYVAHVDHMLLGVFGIGAWFLPAQFAVLLIRSGSRALQLPCRLARRKSQTTSWLPPRRSFPHRCLFS